ncbi:MAG TPA: EamA family transporter [Verrucomicrobiota bacterium]|nr:hypothetical protein [Verrucomicrobiales bacterium]HRI14721.1 EamA family transporter [Verrucomicrobiota bacterium]
MWLVYALGAAVLWGINYSASGRVINRGVSPATLFFLDTILALLVIGGVVILTGKGRASIGELRQLGGDWGWLVAAMVCSTVGGLLVLLAIEHKNATLASLIEISYPLFVALFAWLFFRESQLNWPTVAGGLLIMIGVGIVYVGNRT